MGEQGNRYELTRELIGISRFNWSAVSFQERSREFERDKPMTESRQNQHETGIFNPEGVYNTIEIISDA